MIPLAVVAGFVLGAALVLIGLPPEGAGFQLVSTVFGVLLGVAPLLRATRVVIGNPGANGRPSRDADPARSPDA